jgi:hypothetical protein
VLVEVTGRPDAARREAPGLTFFGTLFDDMRLGTITGQVSATLGVTVWGSEKPTYFGLERKESHDVSATSEIREMYVSLPAAAILSKKKWAVQDSNWITER